MASSPARKMCDWHDTFDAQLAPGDAFWRLFRFCLFSGICVCVSLSLSAPLTDNVLRRQRLALLFAHRLLSIQKTNASNFQKRENRRGLLIGCASGYRAGKALTARVRPIRRGGEEESLFLFCVMASVAEEQRARARTLLQTAVKIACPKESEVAIFVFAFQFFVVDFAFPPLLFNPQNSVFSRIIASHASIHISQDHLSGLVQQFENGLFQIHAANAEHYIKAVNDKLVAINPESEKLTADPPKSEVRERAFGMTLF